MSNNGESIVGELSILAEHLPDPAIIARAFDHVPSAVLIVDDAGTLYFVNQQIEVLFGYERSEVIGKPVDIFVPEDLRDRHIKHRSGFAISPRPRSMGAGLKLQAQKKNGIRFPVEINLGPFNTKRGVFTVATIVPVGSAEV
jgi:PAS domain S-box-containing protein